MIAHLNESVTFWKELKHGNTFGRSQWSGTNHFKFKFKDEN